MRFPILDPLQPGKSTVRAGRCALTIMAKAPRPGRVKTRLSPPLTPAQSAELNTCLLRDTAECIAGVARSGAAEPVVSYTPVEDAALFAELLPDTFSLIPQRGETFGERLLFTAEDLLACGFSSVCLIDSDSPTVPPTAYARAAQALAQPGERVVLGPTADGGYYLIGIKRADPTLFEQIAWSTGAVYTQTVAQAQSAGYEVIELPLWYDIDDASTLNLLRAELLAGIAPGFALEPGYPAPNTRALLERMDALPSETLSAGPEAGGSADLPVEAAQRPLERTIEEIGDKQ